MIKFFRKIRQKLLSENKFSKYLIYAIGEIILVVIGILIALQINNWNEKRKVENKGKEYVNEIYKELKIENSNIDDILLSLQNQYNATKDVLSYFESEFKEIRDTVQFTKNQWATTRLFIIDRDLNTFDKLKSSGQSALLKNDSLSNLLDNFYKNFDIRILNFKEFPLQIRMDLRRAAFPLGTANDFKYENENSKLTAAYIREYLNNDEVYEHLLSILKTCQFNTNFFEDLSAEAIQLINYMEDNYPELKNIK
ncbi:DUF6090 family protein [Ichthyenterobacterium sp. W332]|uniref:DUF6090 family protein n=1 Tax=Microcosmobacter mediterraneus TaxID=3075607 RepID=A0ABU2YHP5_9FLAO|nr:DUF6090 family protein [Ichthyenterobacterium sp. W332]MDT0557219.1 DUF6090 family protein [Ichthyenterobacterium sp. W332]